MEIFKGGKTNDPENTSGYSEEEGKKIDALTAQAITLFKSWGSVVEAGMAADAALVSVATFLGTGWKDREAMERNLPRLTESFKRVMRYAFDKKDTRGRG